MNDYVDMKGASGASYRFLRLKDGRPLSPAGGNFLYGRYTGSRFELLYAGEVQNLLKDARVRWSEAVARHQASDLFTRLNISERVRQLEHADIVRANDPPMNAAPEPAVGPSQSRLFGARGGQDQGPPIRVSSSRAPDANSPAA